MTISKVGMLHTKLSSGVWLNRACKTAFIIAWKHHGTNSLQLVGDADCIERQLNGALLISQGD